MGLIFDLRQTIKYAWRGNWRETYYSFRAVLDDVMWYVRGVYAPHNVLKLRNVGRRYVHDANVRLLHAMFSILCRHVERGEGGRAALANLAAGAYEQRQRDAYSKMLELYDWYLSVNWEEPVPSPPEDASREQWQAWICADEKFHGEVCAEKMHALVSVRQYMWT